jgi:rubrerythrin
MRKKRDTVGTPTYSKNFSQKIKKSKSQHSILHKHEQRLEELSVNNKKLQKINADIKYIEKELKNVKGETDHKNDDKNKKTLQNLKNEKKKLDNNTVLCEYLLDSAQIIEKYIRLETRESELLNLNELSEEISLELNEINEKKTDLVEEYLLKFEPESKMHKMTIKHESLICSDCNVTFTIANSYLVCPLCGICKNTIEQANELSYKEKQDYDYRPQFTYDKRSHLEDWLRRFQNKEARAIPQDVLDKVILEAKKERINDLNALTEEKVKRYLKKLNLNDYYDNVIGIINRLNGRPPFTLTQEIEEKIKKMFQQIQEPYEKFKPPSRKNFLSYSYTLCKFFQILNLHEFARYFPLLKSNDKLRQQDDIFKKIVGHMSEIDKTTKWVFYPSV